MRFRPAQSAIFRLSAFWEWSFRFHCQSESWSGISNLNKYYRNQGILCLCSFYRRLVPNFAQITKPLTTLTTKDQKFEWGPIQIEAFEGLKNKLCTTPVLAFPHFELPFILTTDTSKLEVAAVLSQVQDSVECPIAYASRQMSRAEQAFSTSEAETLALVWAKLFPFLSPW